MKFVDIKKKINVSWKMVIISAVITGIYAGVMAMIPATENTSFRDISISFEWWILFGILIIMGSRSNKDAALKCFVFFLISQPLVYLVQVCFGAAGWDIFSYYKRWFIFTLLTLPMGYIGYYMKNDNIWCLLILAPILLLLGTHLNDFLGEAIYFFPNHLLSAIFCVLTMYGYIFLVFSHKRERIIGAIFCTVIFGACLVMNLVEDRSYETTVFCSSDEIYFDDSFDVRLEEPSYGDVKISAVDFYAGEEKHSNYCIDATFRRIGKTKMMLTGENERVFDLTIERWSFNWEEAK